MPQWLERLIYQWNGWMDRTTASLRPSVPAPASSRLALLSSAATLCDENGIILAANAPFEALSGYRAEELVGQLAPALRSGLYDTGLMVLIQQAVAVKLLSIYSCASNTSHEIFKRHEVIFTTNLF